VRCNSEENLKFGLDDCLSISLPNLADGLRKTLAKIAYGKIA